MFTTIRKFSADETGATAIEYGLIAGLVSVAAIFALTQMGQSLQNIFGVVKTQLDSAATSASGSATP